MSSAFIAILLLLASSVVHCKLFNSSAGRELVSELLSKTENYLIAGPSQPALTDFLKAARKKTKNSTKSKKLWRYESRLLRLLFSAEDPYNTEIRPAKRNLEPVVVTVEFVLRQITDLHEKSQQIAVSGFLKITWIDERLTWLPEHFGGVEWIVVSPDSIWLPDIALVNSDELYCITKGGGFPVTLTASGEIFFVPAGKIFARCNFDLRYFPFDYQLCRYRFESWVYTAEFVTLVGTNFTIDSDHYVDNHQWEIRLKFVKTSIVKYEEYNFSRVEFFLLLRRKSIYFITYTIFPCIALSTLQIVSHMLPFTEKERITFATAILIAFSVFHVSIVDQMPKTSFGIPLLAIYIDGLMCLIGISLVECFFMINWLARIECSVPSPVWWKNVVERWGDYVMLGSNGLYWRRNYLRIYYEVCAKNDADDQVQRKTRASCDKRKKSRLKRGESFSNKFGSLLVSTSIGGGAFDKRESFDIKGLHLPTNEDVDIVLKIAKRWGWRGRRRTSVPMDLDLLGLRSDNDNKEGVVQDMEQLDALSGLCIGHLQSSLPFKFRNDKGDSDKTNSSSDDEDSYTSGPKSMLRSFTTIKIIQDLSRTMSEADGKDRRRLQAEWKHTERQLTSALKYLNELGKVVKAGLYAHNLRRECIQVWITYITVVDRMISAFLLVICAACPIALFIIFPAVVPVPDLPAH